MILVQRLNVQLRIEDRELPEYEREGFAPVALPEAPAREPEKAATKPAKRRSKKKQ